MSSLIKHGHLTGALVVEARNWRALGTHGDDQPVSSVQSSPELQALETEISRLKDELAASKTQHVQALISARDQGRKDAEIAYARDETKSLATLEGGVAAALKDANHKLDSLEPITLALCQIVLERIFVDAKDYRDLVTNAIQLQLSGLRRGMALSVRVSHADFPDAGALQNLQTVLADDGLSIRQDHTLAAGSCHIDLRLGHIELSIPDHWDALLTQLRVLAASSEEV